MKIKRKQIASHAFPVIIIFLFLVHHLFDLWSKPAISIVLLTAAILPATILFVYLFFQKAQTKFFQIQKTKRVVFIVSSFLVAVIFTLLTYRLPESYSKITIIPDGSGAVELMEIKVAGDVINIGDEASQSGWQFDDGVYSPGPDARPLVVYVKTKVNSTCDILFAGSSKDASASVSSGLFKETVLFTEDVISQELVSFHSGYRGVPGVLFIFIIGLIDLIAYSILVLFIFVLQENLEEAKAVDNLTSERFKTHLPYLTVLFIGTVLLHLWLVLAVPLIVDVDSPTYLQGAVHLIQEGNLRGVSPIRGPGTTFLFAPIFLIFGRNPWGLKIFLHIVSIASVFVGYWIGWQLSANKASAFLTGLFILLSPDIYLSSVFVMSDALNLFFVALFFALVINAYQKMSFLRVLLALVSGTFIVFLRSENLLVLFVGVLILATKPLYILITKKENLLSSKNARTLKWIGISFFVAALPLLWWSFYNYQYNGFFGLSDYASEVFYDGWVYFGDASGLSFSDKESPAMQSIDSIIENYPVDISDRSGAATGWELFPYILEAGYSRQEAFELLHDATMDSIKNDWQKTLQLTMIKIRTALTPDPYPLFTYPLPGENPGQRSVEQLYFDQQPISFPFLITSFRNYNAFVNNNYSSIYRYWFYLSLISLYFVLHKKPNEIWFGLAIIILAKIFIPNILGIAIWRYTISAVLLLQVFLAYWLSSIIFGLLNMFKNKQRKETSAVQ